MEYNATHEQHLQTIAARQQVIIAQRQLETQEVINFEMTRKNDLEEKTQNITNDTNNIKK